MCSKGYSSRCAPKCGSIAAATNKSTVAGICGCGGEWRANRGTTKGGLKQIDRAAHRQVRRPEADNGEDLVGQRGPEQRFRRRGTCVPALPGSSAIVKLITSRDNVRVNRSSRSCSYATFANRFDLDPDI